MADVNDRGQLIVISGLVLAVTFVALALVVNGAIYTENVASRDTSIESSHAQAERFLVEQDLGSLIDRSNRETAADDWSSVESAFLEGFDDWSAAQRDRAGVTGRSFSSTIESITEGSHVRQTDPARNFTAGGDQAGDPDWTLGDNVTEAGPFRLEVERSSLLNVSGFDSSLTDPVEAVSDNAFHVDVSNENGTWRVYLFRDGSTGTVYLYTVGPDDDTLSEQFDNVNDSGGLIESDHICASGSTSEDYATVDFRDSTFGSDPHTCGGLDFYEESVLGANHTVEYRNARTSSTLDLIDDSDRARGTYEVVFDRRVDRAPYYDPTADEDPSANAVIYSATVEFEYYAARLGFQSDTLTASWEVEA